MRGRILLATYKPPPLETPRPGFHWELDNGFKETLKDRVPVQREIAVVLTSEGEGSTAQRDVKLSGGNLLPSTLVIRAGTTVSIENHDEVAHELYAVGLKVFTPEAIAPRGRRAINLTEAGSWPLLDKLVPHARAHLHVLPNLVSVAKMQSDGSFTFEDVPPGEYKLLVFHGAKQIASQTVTMTDRSLTLDPFTPQADEGQSK